MNKHLQEYRVTFAEKYESEIHPLFVQAHPDGWLTIIAPDYDTARKAAIDNLGEYWGQLWAVYHDGRTEDEWLDQFPRGMLGRVVVSNGTTHENDTDPKEQIKQIVQEACGSVSMCWDPRPGDQVFQSEEAGKIAEEATEKIYALVDRAWITGGQFVANTVVNALLPITSEKV